LPSLIAKVYWADTIIHHRSSWEENSYPEFSFYFGLVAFFSPLSECSQALYFLRLDPSQAINDELTRKILSSKAQALSQQPIKTPSLPLV
jgi:hypothetical protein